MSTQSDADRYGISDEDFRESNRRGEEMRRNVPWAIAARYEPTLERILTLLSSGLEVVLPIESYAFLANAAKPQRSRIEISAGGYELYFPDLDEGIWLPNHLLKHAEVTRWLRENPEAA